MRAPTFLLLSILWLPGCGGTDAKLRAEVEGLTANVDLLRAELNKLQKDVAAVEVSVSAAHGAIRRNARRLTAEFDPTESSYLPIETDLGRFAVSISDVRQFADGVRVKLNLGNLSSATFNGVTLKLSYGPRSPEGRKAGEALNWLNALQEREEVVTAKLFPGSWNPVQITLPKIDAKEFGYLEVGIETNQISLR